MADQIVTDPHLGSESESHTETILDQYHHHYDDNVEDMDFPLNPEAKVFVPTTPLWTPDSSPFLGNGDAANPVHPLNRASQLIDNDCVIAQSPRKGGTPMEDIQVPTEHDFDDDISHRPMELETLSPAVGQANCSDRPGSSGSTYSYQEMNLKEAMHGDEKMVDEYTTNNDNTDPLSSAVEEAAAVSTVEHATERFMRESDPMSMSFYNDGNDSASNNPFTVDLNAVQFLPQVDDDDDKENNLQHEDEEKQQQSVAPEPSYHFDGASGQHFVIQDTVFGIHHGIDTAGTAANAPAFHSELVHPEEDMNPVTRQMLVEEIHEEMKPSQYDIDKATSMLAEVRLSDGQPEALNTTTGDDENICVYDLLEESQQLKATTADCVAVAVQRRASMEELAESDQNCSQMPAAVTEEYHADTEIEEEKQAQALHLVATETLTELLQQTLRPVVGDVIEIEPAATISDAVQHTDTEVTTAVEAAAERLLSTGTAVDAAGIPVAITLSARKTPLKVVGTAAAASKKTVDVVKPKTMAVKRTSVTTKSGPSVTPLGTAARTAVTAGARPKNVIGVMSTNATAARSTNAVTNTKPAAKKPSANGSAKSSTTHISGAATTTTKKPATTVGGVSRSVTVTSARSVGSKSIVAARSTVTGVAVLRAPATLKSSVSTTSSATTKSALTTTKVTTNTR